MTSFPSGSNNLSPFPLSSSGRTGILNVCPTPWCHRVHWSMNMDSPYSYHFCKNSGGCNHTGICIVTANSHLDHSADQFFNTYCHTNNCHRLRKHVSGFCYCCNECVVSDGQQHSRECVLFHSGAIRPDRTRCVTHGCNRYPYQDKNGTPRICCRTCFLTCGRQHDTQCNEINHYRIQSLSHQIDQYDIGDDRGSSQSNKRFRTSQDM